MHKLQWETEGCRQTGSVEAFSVSVSNPKQLNTLIKMSWDVKDVYIVGEGKAESGLIQLKIEWLVVYFVFLMSLNIKTMKWVHNEGIHIVAVMLS